MIKKIIIIFILLMLVIQCFVYAESAYYTTEDKDKYTKRINVYYKDFSNKYVEIVSYSPNYSTKTVKIFYKATQEPDRNYIDIDTRSYYGKIRIILENIENNKLPFNDIKGTEAEIYIRHLHDEGLINGYNDGSFKPGGTISRAEFFTMIIRALDIEIKNYTDTVFKDITNHWARDEIMTAVSLGLVKGYDDNTVKPDKNITVGQAAMVIDRAFNLNTYGNNSIYKKLPQKHYAKESVKKMLDANIIKTSDSVYENFNIDKSATRAECVTMISRALVN